MGYTGSLMKKLVYTFYLVSALVFALPAITVRGDDVIVGDTDDPDATITYITLGWDQNPENDIGGYNVYYGRDSGDYERIKTVGDVMATIGVKGTNSVYFAVTAFNLDGVESDLSDEVSWP